MVASTPERSFQAGLELGAEQQFADALALIAHPDVDVVHIKCPEPSALRLGRVRHGPRHARGVREAPGYDLV